MSVYDRDYMKPEPRRFGFRLPHMSATLALTLLLIAAFVAQSLAMSSGLGGFIRENLCFSGGSLKEGKVWILLTSAFLHGGLGHIFANLIGVWCFGRGVELEHGAKRFWQVFLLGSLAGSLLTALIWCLPSAWVNPDVLEYRDRIASLGASCGIMALGGYFFADKLKEEFTALLYFVLPVRLSGRIFLGVLAGVSVLGLIFSEIPVATGWWKIGIHETDISHSGHLGGILFGFLWRRWQLRERTRSRPTLRVLKPEFSDRPDSGKFRETERRFPSAPPSTPDLRAEVDRILDKINRQGFGALTPDERAILEKARQTLNR